MHKKYVIKHWNKSSDYWSYLREKSLRKENKPLFDTVEANLFVSGTIKDAKLFNSLEEAEKYLDGFLMTPNYFKIDSVYIPKILTNV